MALDSSFQGESIAENFLLEHEIKQEYKWNPDYFEEEFNLPLPPSVDIKNELWAGFFEEVNDEPTAETLSQFYNECDAEQICGVEENEDTLDYKPIYLRSLVALEQIDSPELTVTEMPHRKRGRPPRRKRGRPPKSSTLFGERPPVKSVQELCRKRGRPPLEAAKKQVFPRQGLQKVLQKYGLVKPCIFPKGIDPVGVHQKLKRKRGRPPKARVIADVTVATEDLQKFHRRVGRPPKHAQGERQLRREYHHKFQELHHHSENSLEPNVSCKGLDRVGPLEKVHRKRGRPPKSRTCSEVPFKTLFKGLLQKEPLLMKYVNSEKFLMQEGVQKVFRKRGRPPKSLVSSEIFYKTHIKKLHWKRRLSLISRGVPEKLLRIGLQKVHRKRGRPPKSPMVSNWTLQNIHLHNLNQKLGRPPRFAHMETTFPRKFEQPLNSLAVPEASCAVKDQGELHSDSERLSEYSVVCGALLKPKDSVQVVRRKRGRPSKSCVISDWTSRTGGMRNLFQKLGRRPECVGNKMTFPSEFEQPPKSLAVPEESCAVEGQQERLHESEQPSERIVGSGDVLKRGEPPGVVHRKRGRPPKPRVLSDTNSQAGVLQNLYQELGRPPKCARTERTFPSDYKQPPNSFAVPEESCAVTGQQKLHDDSEQLSECIEGSGDISKSDEPPGVVHRKRGRPPKSRVVSDWTSQNYCVQNLHEELGQPSVCEATEGTLPRELKAPPSLVVREESCAVEGHQGLLQEREQPSEYILGSGDVLKRSEPPGVVHRKRGRPPKSRVVSDWTSQNNCVQNPHEELGQPSVCEATEGTLPRELTAPPALAVPEESCAVEGHQGLLQEREQPSEYILGSGDVLKRSEPPGVVHRKRGRPPKSRVVSDWTSQNNCVQNPHEDFGQPSVCEATEGTLPRELTAPPALAVREESCAVEGHQGLLQEREQPSEYILGSGDVLKRSEPPGVVHRKRGRPPKSRVVSDWTSQSGGVQNLHLKLTQPPECATTERKSPIEYKQPPKSFTVPEASCAAEGQPALYCESDEATDLIVVSGGLKRVVSPQLMRRKRGRPPKPRAISESLCKTKLNRFPISDNSCKTGFNGSQVTFMSSVRQQGLGKVMQKEGMQTVHRKRGRPPRSPAVFEKPLKICLESGFQRKRGRPPRLQMISDNFIKIECLGKILKKRGRPPKSCTVFQKPLKSCIKDGHHRKHGRPPRLIVISDKVKKLGGFRKIVRKRGRPPKLAKQVEEGKSNNLQVIWGGSKSYSEQVDSKGEAEYHRMCRKKKLPERYHDGVHSKELQRILLEEIHRKKIRNNTNKPATEGVEETGELESQVFDNTTQVTDVVEVEANEPLEELGYPRVMLTALKVPADARVQFKQGHPATPQKTSEISSRSLEALPQKLGLPPHSNSVAEDFLKVLGLQRLDQKCGQPAKSTLVQNALKVRYLLRRRSALSVATSANLQEAMKVNGVQKLFKKRGRPPKLVTLCEKPLPKTEEGARRKPGRPRKHHFVPVGELKAGSMGRSLQDCRWPHKSSADCQAARL